MKPDESVEDSKPEEDQPPDSVDRSPDDGFEIPFPAPADSGTRGYAVEIFGDERGGQIPKLPPRRKGDPDE